jgi:hypothetical protein
LWAATFQDVTKYMRERQHGRVQTLWSGEAIEIRLDHDLDRDIYDLPLTLKTYVPSGWSTVEIRQGIRVRRQPVIRDGRGSYVLFQAAPNAEPIKLVNRER